MKTETNIRVIVYVLFNLMRKRTRTLESNRAELEETGERRAYILRLYLVAVLTIHEYFFFWVDISTAC